MKGMEAMVLKVLPTGMFGSNNYILGVGEEGVIIDAGVDVQEVADAVKEMGLRIKYILLTHGHVDHVYRSEDLRRKLGVPLMIHEGDGGYLSEPDAHKPVLIKIDMNVKAADRLLKDGERIALGDKELTMLHTPGHTPGGMCILIDGMLFTGDTLFKLSIGRTDLPGGDHNQLMNSLKNKLMLLPADTVVYPGHGQPTTIGYEKNFNPFLNPPLK